MQALCRSLFNLAPKKVQTRLLQHKPFFAGTARINLPDRSTLKFDNLDQSQMLKGIFWKGIRFYEFDTIMAFWELSRNARVIFDIGSYIGYYSMVASRANPNATIYSFEPLPDNASLQRHYLEINDCANVKLLEMAVGMTDDETVFYVPNKSHSLLPNIGSLKNRFKAGETFSDRGSKEIPVQVTTLDTFMETAQLSGLDLIKIDVEELEWEVISGATKSIERYKPDIIAEVAPEKEHSKRLFKILRDMGYHVFDINDGRIIKIDRVDDIFNLRTVGAGTYGEVLFSHRIEDNILLKNQTLV